MTHPGRPGKFLLLLVLFQQSTPGLANAIDLLTLNFASGDETALFEHLERRIDRARAGRIEAARSLLQRLDHLIAIHWAFAQQHQQGKLHIAAPKEAPTFTTSEGTTTPKRPTMTKGSAEWATTAAHGKRNRTTWSVMPMMPMMSMPRRVLHPGRCPARPPLASVI